MEASLLTFDWFPGRTHLHHCLQHCPFLSLAREPIVKSRGGSAAEGLWSKTSRTPGLWALAVVDSDSPDAVEKLERLENVIVFV